MKPRSFLSLPALVLLFGLSVGCATSGVTTNMREVSEIFAARGQSAIAAGVPREEDRRESALAVAQLLSRPLDGDAAVHVALANNRELGAGFYEIGIARGELVQAGLPPNPELDIGLRRSSDATQPIQVDLGVEYDLSALVLLPLRKGVAEAGLAAERRRVAGEVLDAAYRARTGLYAVQARRQELDLRARALKAFQAGYAAAEELYRVGNLPEIDLATHRAAVESARIDVAEAENRLLDAREGLNVALGLSGQQARWTVEAPLPDPLTDAPPIERVEARAVEASLELAELSARMDAASRRADLARTEGSLPHLSGGLHGEHDGLSWEIGGHITVGLPVFDRNQGRVMSANAEHGALRERYVAAATALRATSRAALNRVESAGRRARHYRSVVLPARERALSESVLHYNAMQISVFELLDVQRRVTQTAIAYVETLLDYWSARAALDQILAGRHRGLALGPAGASPSRMPSEGDGAAGGGH